MNPAELETACLRLGVNPGHLQEFCAADPYNPPNILRGYVCRKPDHRYGALVIIDVNGLWTGVQVVYGSPKIEYPFFTDKETGKRVYHWPQFMDVRAYEKFDGTNVVAYSYSDIELRRYVTFKLRLSPVLRASRWGDFKGMWDEILTKHPEVRRPEKVISGEYAFSFEMYGYRNPVLVRYGIPLEASFIFGIRQESAEIVPPDLISVPCDMDAVRNHCFLEWGPHLMNEPSIPGITDFYESLRDKAHKTISVDPEGVIRGTEGYVAYLRTDRAWIQYKAKPEEIEAIHWAPEAIDYNSVYVTAKNALEDLGDDELTEEHVKKLLAEEFSEQQIGRSEARILKAVAEVRDHARFLESVRERYKSFSANFPDSFRDKSVCMKWMVMLFGRDKSRMVYNGLRELGFLP